MGTPAITTRGLKEEHMSQIADWMEKAVKNMSDEKLLNKLSIEVQELAKQFPLPSDK